MKRGFVIIVVLIISMLCLNRLELLAGGNTMKDSFYNKLVELEKEKQWRMLTVDAERIEPSFKRIFEIRTFNPNNSKKIDIKLYTPKQWPSKDIYNYVLSPDGGKIVFVIDDHETSPTSYSLYELNIDNSDIHNILPRKEFPKIGNICYSPNGKDIFFVGKLKDIRETSHFPQFNSLYKLNLQTREITELVQHGVFMLNTQSCSPDGKKIVYENSNFDEICIFDSTTGVSHKLIDGKYPTWPPDGSKISYGGKDGNYYLINPDGSENKLFILNKPKNKFKIFGERIGGISGELLWSPDGHYVYYERAASYLLADVEHYVPYIMDSVTKEEIRLPNDFDRIKSWVGKEE